MHWMTPRGFLRFRFKEIIMWLTCCQPISALFWTNWFFFFLNERLSVLYCCCSYQPLTRKGQALFLLGNRRLIEHHAAMLPVLAASPRHVRAWSVTCYPVKQSSLCGKEQYNSEFGDRLIQIIPHSWHTCGSPFLERFLKLPQHFEGKKSIRLETCRMTQIVSHDTLKPGKKKSFRLNRHMKWTQCSNCLAWA